MKIILALLLCPASRAAVPPDAAVVDGVAIPMSDFKREAAASTEKASEVLEDLITRELLVQQAAREELVVTDNEVSDAEDEIRASFRLDKKTGRAASAEEAEKAFKDMLKRHRLSREQFREKLKPRILARKVIESDVRSKLAPPAEKALRAYFSKVKAYIASKSTGTPSGMDEGEAAAVRGEAARVVLLTSERASVQGILIRWGKTIREHEAALKRAQDVKKLLDEGREFAEVARSKSEDPRSAAQGGDLGTVRPGNRPRRLVDAVFAMEVGSISAPIAIDDGYAIVRVVEKRAAQPIEFESLREDIADSWRRLDFDRKYAAYVKGLYDKAVIERR